MALNYSQRPVFPAHTSEDNLISPLRIVNGYVVEGMSDRGGESFVKPRHGNGEIHDRFGGSPDPVSTDIIDLLPSDPFGMEIDISTTFTAITGWLEDFEVDYVQYVRNNIANTNEDYRLYAGLNLIWNSALRFQSFPSNESPDDKGGASFMDDEDATTSNNEGGDPHEAFVLALTYLGTKDLLLLECVCKTLSSTIRNDSLLWRTIHIDQPLSEKITDDILVQLTNRSEGNLRCLTLIKCPRITDDGLKRVLETNPKLTKLSVPGCTRLSIDGILNNLKAFKLSGTGGTSGIKHIRTDDERDIDVEVCPRCQNLRLVYDCPAEGCFGKDQCRACIICIPRCAQCGRCVHNSEYEETFSLEYLCSGCLKEMPRCQKVQQMDVDVF
ncbi:unnamed protein product [Lactuca virosa]|uniref:F-box domain-containing protein n=1 Tax=Lactuca virosa TaxID=75947 RepID=A0AAU9LNH3_9ASTR|nr:unnamed protein product [Lactuca virosa]